MIIRKRFVDTFLNKPKLIFLTQMVSTIAI